MFSWDIMNAHSAIERAPALSRVNDLLPDLVPWVLLLFATSASLLQHTADGTVEAHTLDRGLKQGGPLSNIFSVCHSLICRTRSRRSCPY